MRFCRQCGHAERSCLSCAAQVQPDAVVCPRWDSEHRVCTQCASLMGLDANFCPSCGRETPEKLKAEQDWLRKALHDRQQAAKAIPLVFLVVGLLALRLLGKSAFRKSLATGTTFTNLALGFMAAGPAFLISCAYAPVLYGGESGGGAEVVTVSMAISWPSASCLTRCRSGCAAASSGKRFDGLSARAIRS